MVKITRKFLASKGVLPIDVNQLAHLAVIRKQFDTDLMRALEPQIKEIEELLIEANLHDGVWCLVDARYFSTDEVRMAMDINFKWLNRDE